MGGGVSRAVVPGGGRAYRGLWGGGFFFTVFAALCHGEWWGEVWCWEEESVAIATVEDEIQILSRLDLNLLRGDWSVNKFSHPGLDGKGFYGFREFVAAFITPQ